MKEMMAFSDGDLKEWNNFNKKNRLKFFDFQFELIDFHF